MDTVHIYCCAKRFVDDAALTNFVEPTFTDDGDMLDSDFMREIALSDEYEPMAIERMLLANPTPIWTAIQDCSYSRQFANQIPREIVADTIICVYSPNIPESPSSTSLTYVGSFTYSPTA